MAGKKNPDESEFHWGVPKKDRPRRRYTGILAKPLPPPDSPDFSAKFRERMTALYSWFGLQPGDKDELLYSLLYHHVPGFRFDRSTNSLNDIEHPNRLLRNLHKPRKGGRRPKMGYIWLLPEAMSYFENKEKEGLSDLVKARHFLKEQVRDYDRKRRARCQALDQAISNVASELGVGTDHPKLREFRERELSTLPENPFKELRASTLVRKVREEREKRKNAT